MTSVDRHREETQGLRGIRWYPDARERLQALLPELVLSVVAFASLSFVISYSSKAYVPSLAIAVLVTQLVTQTILYACTYLIEAPKGTYIAWFFVLTSITLLSYTGLYDSLGFVVAVAAPFAMFLFYSTRVRPLFVMLLIEMLVLSDFIGENVAMIVAHALGLTATAALFVMRGSAERITMSYVPEGLATKKGDEGKSPLSSLGIFGQIAAIGAAVSALCLALALAGLPMLQRQDSSSGDVEDTPTEVVHETDEVQDVSLTEVDSDELPEDVQGIGHVLEVEQQEGTVTEAEQEEGGNPADADGASPSPLTALLLPALLALPFLAKLLMRTWTRRSLEREPRTADRAARIYLGIIDRLSAAGVMRDQTETPLEFLSRQELEIAQLMEPAGIGVDEWCVLTDVYEKARYADLDPTDAELELCWKVYDALPVCAREASGWPRYLTGAFWRM